MLYLGVLCFVDGNCLGRRNGYLRGLQSFSVDSYLVAIRLSHNQLPFHSPKFCNKA